MKRIIVSLVSDQTVPNILAICDMQPDELLFISTAEMEKRNKTAHILSALAGRGGDYGARHSLVTVAEDSLIDCHRKLDAWIVGREDADFTVNLTGGTKIMAIAAYEYFKDYGSRMIYIPIPKNEYVAPFPERLDGATALEARLSVADYLNAYGCRMLNAAKMKGFRDDALKRRALSSWLVEHYSRVKNLLIWLGGALRGHRDDREYLLEGEFSGASAEERELLHRCGIGYEGGRMSHLLPRSEIQYLTGGWLEEYCFCEAHDLLGRGIDDVVMGCKIASPKGTDNEFDVMFTRENALYTVECKSLDQHEDKKTDALYKVAALQKEFGLRVGSFFVSTSPHIMKDGKLKGSVSARAEQFKTTVVKPDEVVAFGAIVRRELRL
jgi:hypothetical protein